ncbi:hypothetical protein [Phyllobacterium sp. 628]|uniref:hypothetical protein n=1 Tax=Phyllobacterium sp. 628 TaxID=2718938 RepID=UPI0035300C1C
MPVAAWVLPPRDVAPPENNVIYNNIHNTIIHNTTTIVQEPAASPKPGLTTGQTLAGAAIAAGATAAALHVALPPSVQKKAVSVQKQNPAAVAKLSASAGAVPAVIKPQDNHSLPGANGSKLPLLNGKPAVQSPTPSQASVPQAGSKLPGKVTTATVKPLPGRALPPAPIVPTVSGESANGNPKNNAVKNASPAAKREALPNVAMHAQPKAIINPHARSVAPIVAKSNAGPRPHNPVVLRPMAQNPRQVNQAGNNAQLRKAFVAKPQAHAQLQPRLQVKRPPAMAPKKPSGKLCGEHGLLACPK